MKRIKTLAGDVYMADEVDAVLKRQAAAAIAGMNAATAISAGQVQQAHRLRAESSPEALESERQANAILTARVAQLESELDTMNLAVGYFHEENDRFITRIAELEKDAARYRFLRDQNIEGDSFPRPGIFIGRTMPDEVLTEKDADAEIDAAIERKKPMEK